MELRYFPAAREDIKRALKWSAENFGQNGAERYKKLIRRAIAEISANPHLQHSHEVYGLQPGIRLFHLKHCRVISSSERGVKRPRHFVAYQASGADVIIVRLLHERMDIERQLRGDS